MCIKDLVSSEKMQEMIRFVVVGIIATAIHYGVYLLLNNWINVNIAYTLGYIISFVCNFFLSNYFTFKTKPTLKKGVGFTFSHATNYIMHMILLNIMLYVGVPKQFAPIPVLCIVVPMNFLLVRFFLKNKGTQ